MTPFCAPPKSLMKEGVWIVPESERPSNWRSISEKENVPVPAVEVETPAVEIAPSIEYPLPPPQYNAVFLPIFEGLRKGLLARRELLDLTHYCMSLEVVLQEQDIKRAQGYVGVDPETGAASEPKTLAEAAKQ